MTTYTKLNPAQLLALSKMAQGPAYVDRIGYPEGVTKHHDGTTFNGNLRYTLFKRGLIESAPTGEVTNHISRTTKSTYKLVAYKFTITPLGLATLERETA